MITLTKTNDEAGLRSFLCSIYNWLIVGTLVTAATAWFSDYSGITAHLAKGGLLFWVALLAPFGLLFVMGAGLSGRSSISTMMFGYLALTVCEGFTLSVVLTKYTGASIVMAFMCTAVGFLALSLFGYTTKRNLTGMGNFFLVALVGLIVAMLLSIFIGSSGLNLLINIAGVVIFAGLIAFDTQTMRDAYRAGDNDGNARMALWSALDLYLDFLNMFLFILRLMGAASSDD